ncbi:Zinc transporter 7 [Trichoplax sp. H2]|nr:Zinc transporter 7 [Trichoplax sp. H2]|eukprot:RDD40208.1 Zinc transporter 7 [Trichoplax sp. H2]
MMLPLYEGEKKKSSSWRCKNAIVTWFRTILSETNSRNLFLFLCLNFSFAFVELTFGIYSNSLGLISDAFHMFFDCTALIAGLIAVVVSRKPHNETYSYGYLRSEIIAGFLNGVFLLFVGFFVFAEAIERAFQPPEVKHERLLVVSIMGFIVNMVGIFAFQHGHGHSHGGHGHSHGGHGHSHGGHAHGLDNGSHNSFASGHSQDTSIEDKADIPGSQQKIMHGIFLHVLADTLGSVGVIISSYLLSRYGWMMADPICSMFIAVLIVISVYPLVSDSITILMQRTPAEIEHILPTCYQQVLSVEGILSYHEPHFWTLCSNVTVGTLRVVIDPNANYSMVLNEVRHIFTRVGVQQLTVQIEYQ